MKYEKNKISIELELRWKMVDELFFILLAGDPWWRHQMETFSALPAIYAGNSPVPGPTQRPVTRSFHVFFDLRLNKWLSKQSWGWWFDTLFRSLWRHRNGNFITVWKVRIIHLLTSHVFEPWHNRFCAIHYTMWQRDCSTRTVDYFLQKTGGLPNQFPPFQ